MQSHCYEPFHDCFRRTHHLDKLYSVRLSDTEIRILNEYYPGESLSFQLRSAIHALRRHGSPPQE